jgi:hypothetical protein
MEYILPMISDFSEQYHDYLDKRQYPKGSASNTGPATQAEMNIYTRIAMLNVCIARSAGVDFNTSVAIAGESMAQLIQGQHLGQIQQVPGKILGIEELRKGSINAAVLGAAEICPQSVPPEVMKNVGAALK